MYRCKHWFRKIQGQGHSSRSNIKFVQVGFFGGGFHFFEITCYSQHQLLHFHSTSYYWANHNTRAIFVEKKKMDKQ